MTPICPIEDAAVRAAPPTDYNDPVNILNQGWRSRLRKLSPPNLRDAAVAAFRDDVIVMDWVNRGLVRMNWGDAVAPVIVSHLSGRRVVNRRDIVNVKGRTVYTTIGSMMGTVDVAGFEVWGSGFVDSRAHLSAQPGKIHVVRGPLTRKKLVGFGVTCPPIYGDPALVFPHVYTPEGDKKYKLGVIPHFKEGALPAVQGLAAQGAHIIDIRGGITNVIDEISSCERIASSSLHGLVAADAYNIPAIWVKFSDRPYGDGFKFRDYLESTASRAEDPLFIDITTTVKDVTMRFESQPEPTTIELLKQNLIEHCPFLAT